MPLPCWASAAGEFDAGSNLMKSGSLGWIQTTNPPLQRRMLYRLSYKAIIGWSRVMKPFSQLKRVAHPGAAPGASCLQNRRVRWLSRARCLEWNWTRDPDSHRVEKGCSLPIRLLIFRAWWNGFPGRCCPGSASFTTKNAAVTPRREERHGAACRTLTGTTNLEGLHAAPYINAALKNGRWSWGRTNLCGASVRRSSV